MARDRLDPAVNAPGRANEATPGHILVPCPVCLKKFKPKQPHQVFCCPYCREMSFWMRRIARALAAGGAEGLRDEIRALGSSTLTVKVVSVVDSGKGTTTEDRRN